jgi:outer membrane putative beta-barrel porin/alpha-amylase
MERRGVALGILLIRLALPAGIAVSGVEAAAGTEEMPELQTDRPDFTETSVVVPRGSLQIEGGFTATDGTGSDRLLNAPELLLRYGVGPHIEVRIALPDYVIARGTSRIGQFADAYLGLKLQLLPSGARTGVALIPAVTLPTGGHDATSHRVDPALVLAWSRELSEAWSVGGGVGLAWPTEEGARNRTSALTLSFGHGLSDRWGTFFEWAAEFPGRGGDIHLLHHGYTYAVTSVSQADFHLGLGLSSAAPDFFLGGGFAVRY